MRVDAAIAFLYGGAGCIVACGKACNANPWVLHMELFQRYGELQPQLVDALYSVLYAGHAPCYHTIYTMDVALLYTVLSTQQRAGYRASCGCRGSSELTPPHPAYVDALD